MDKAYDPKKYEENILKKWNDAKAFLPKTPAQSKTGKSFTVPIPPPNVTGTLHLGHAMMVVVEDIMTRYHRMKGDATLWLPGTDHAAIATESVVLKNLGVPSREIFTREEFLEKCFDHTKKSQATITNQVKKMGASCDFTRERYTMDLGLSNAVWKIFKDLYEHNLIVRGYRMVNWSTKAQSVLADDELEYEDKKEPFFYIKCGRFVMGTVRSETKCADSPLVIHPDENYVVARFFPENSLSLRERVGMRDFEEFVFSEVLFDDEPRRNKIFNQLGEGKWEKISVHQGKFFEGEEFEAETFAGKRKFFVLTDAEVIDINKGTGAMTISVNHSADDYFLAKKYPEKLKNYYIEKIGLDGKMTKVAGELEGVEVEIARKRAAKMMTEKGILVGIDKDYVHNVPLCYRTGCVVEPMISPQWFIDVNKEFDWQENIGAIQNSKFKIQNEGKIFLARHGESEGNVQKLMQGHLNFDLSEKGKQDARDLAEKIRNNNITTIITSGLKRALHTAEIVKNELEIDEDIIVLEELNEIDWKEYAGKSGEIIGNKKSVEFYLENNIGESIEELYERARKAKEKVEHYTKKANSNVLIISHGQFSHFLFAENNIDIKDFLKFHKTSQHLQNGEVRELVRKQHGNFEIYLQNIYSLLKMEKEEGKIYSPHKKYAIGDVDDGTKKYLQTENTEIVISEFIYAKIKGWIPHLSGHNEIFESDFYFLPILLQHPLEIFEDTKTQYRYMVLPSFKGTRSFIVVLDGKKEKAEIVSFFYTNQKNKYAKEGDRFHQIQKRRESLEGPAIVPSCITSELRRELKRLVAGEGEPSFTSRQTLSHTEIIKFFTANQLLNLEPEIQNPKTIKTTLKKLTLEAITQHGGQTNIIPDRFVKIYDQWIENLQDWCISRQIWWGHQIPVWYDENGNEFVAHEQKILFARHGESEDNQSDIIGGNSSLTEKGKKQAEELAQKLILEGRNIKKIYCSSLKRSRQTAEIVAKIVGTKNLSPLHIEEFPDFHEIFAGDLENQKRIVEKKYPHTVHKMLDLKTGETLEELENRAKNFWKNISELSPEDGEILFVGHRSFLSMVFAVKDGRFGQTLVDYRDRWEMDKCEVKEISWMMKPKMNGELHQDQDTLDTWFSSALWPFSTLGWPDRTPDFENFYPTSVLETGHDILFFWVARMIMFGRFATGKNPFKDVYLHGLVCDEHGKKMSKSKGNGIDPLEMIEKFGTDALRMALVVGTTPGNQVNLGEKKIEGFRNFANKIWNISRYILAMEDSLSLRERAGVRDDTQKLPHPNLLPNGEGISLPEQWILSKTQTLIAEISDGLENHKYGEVGQKLYDFAWNDVADWAIESAKAVESETIGNTLQYVLEILLKLLHPYMPFISEVIWEEMNDHTNLLLLEDFPSLQENLKNPKAEEQFLILQEVISSIRSLRSASKVDPVKKIVAILNGKNVEFLQENAEIIKLLARLETLQFDEKTEEKCVQDLVNGTEILLPLSGMLDEGLEKQRKEKELFEAKKLLQNLESRLNNEKYMASAPQNLVEQTRKQHAEVLEKIKILEG